MNKKLLLSVLVAIGIIGSGLIWYGANSNDFETIEVGQETLKNQTTLVGTVKANKDLDLGFEVTGKVSEVRFTENQEVKAGDVLIELNKKDLYALRSQAYATLNEAKSSLKQQEQQVQLEQAKLEDLKSGGSSEEIKVAESIVNLKKQELKKAQDLLDEGVVLNSQNTENILNEARVTLENALNQALSNLYTLTDIQFEVYPQETNDSILVGFHKAKAAQQLVGISDAARFRNNILSESRGGMVDAFKNARYENIDEALLLSSDLKIGVREISNAYLFFTINDEVSEATIDLINAQKTIVANEISKLNSLEERLSGSIRTNQNNLINLQSNLSIAEKSLEQAEADLRRVKTGADTNDIQLQEIALEQAKSLVESRRARVQYENGRIAGINADIEKRTIISPIDGTIIDLGISEGEIVGLSQNVVTVQAENDLLIEVDAPERYVSFLENGQKVEVQLDAFPETKLEGEVVKVRKESSLIDNVPVFKIDIKLETKGLNVRSGMTGDVIMTLEEVVDAVSVPALVIQKDETGEYVNVILERKLITIEKRYIKTGTIGNNGLVEVIEGLKVGDEVLVNQQDD
jgi:RND family efflux transporter MFP subunit